MEHLLMVDDVTLTLEDLAAFLDSEKTLEEYPEAVRTGLAFLAAGQAVIRLLPKPYALIRTLNLPVSAILEGCGAELRGNGLALGIRILCGDTRVENLSISGCDTAVDLDPQGGRMHHVTVEGVEVALRQNAFVFGSSKSDGWMKDIVFRNCTVVGCDRWEENELAMVMPFTGAAALGRKGNQDDICNCVLENLVFEKNKVKGTLRLAFNVEAAYPAMGGLASFKGHLMHNTLRNLRILDNEIEECWDSPYNIVASFLGCEGSVIDGIELAGNKVGFGIAGIYLYAGEPVMGLSVGNVIRNVRIHHNTFTRVIDDVGEPTRGLFIAAARSDYYPGTRICDALMEHVEIDNNRLEGAGVVLCGAYALLDGDGLCRGNVLRHVQVHHNTIVNADCAFRFEAAQMEGRRYDWNFGYPRHDKKWADPITDDEAVTLRMEDNRIEDLTCTDNIIEGYRYQVTAAGVNGHGHGLGKGNRVCDGIAYRNNHFGVGEGHLHVADFIGDDFVRDGGDNKVDKALMKR